MVMLQAVSVSLNPYEYKLFMHERAFCYTTLFHNIRNVCMFIFNQNVHYVHYILEQSCVYVGGGGSSMRFRFFGGARLFEKAGTWYMRTSAYREPNLRRELFYPSTGSRGRSCSTVK